MMNFVIKLSLCFCLLFIVGDSRFQKIFRAKRNVRVKSVYFVHMKSSVTTAKIHDYVSDLIQLQKNNSISGFDIELHGIVQEVAYGFSAKLSKVALQKIIDSDEVDSVNEDHYMKAGSTDNIVYSWGLDRLDGKPYNSQYQRPCNLTGKGVDVYVLDSGIWYTHNEFEGRAMSAGCDPVDQLFGTNRSGLDCMGHGTHVAGNIGGKTFGVANEATIFSVRVLDCTNLGTANTIVLGAECVIKKAMKRKRPSVVNLSIYGEKNLIVKRALDVLMRKGISVISIAGNNENNPQDSCKVAPGSIHGVITASASTRNDKPFVYSNAGVCVDLYAPGSDIQSAAHICDICRSTRSGSSMAASHVTGAIALLLEKCPTITPWRVRHLLLSQMVQPNKLDFSVLPSRFQQTTPNLLLHTSSLPCNLQC